ncbi:MAG: serine racemase VanT catalytic subunit [Coriobacteriia bacterium]|nr:serine racemase VanT catalytic subunit [Coriobacteriia bacterium]
MEINLENLRHNVTVLKGMLPSECQLMPAVKANAYGLGAVRLCKELNRLGIRAFCVATALEGAELRKGGVKGEILILGYTHPKQLDLVKRYRLMQTVVDYQYAQTLRNYGKRLTVHLAIDTGMGRLGESAHNLESILEVFTYNNLNVEGIFTHLSAQSKDYTHTQVALFSELLNGLEGRGVGALKAHLQSSYGILHCPGLNYAYARVGIALYGAANHDELKPVLSIKARVSVVKTVAAGQAIGYGLGFIAPKDMKIAVISIGYGDGLPRALSCGVGMVLIHGARASILGYVCMDQTIVDVSSINRVYQGDTAVILGKSGALEMSAESIAKQLQTVPNEILSRLGTRLTRVYTH